MLLALVAVGMTVPAMAWSVHGISHAGKPVAVDQHHEHDEATGEVTVHEDGATNEPAGKSGHDHMPALMAAQPALDATALILPAVSPSADGPLYFSSATTADRSQHAGRLRRPPRFA
ncbi:hypothetical protein [Polymorphobacter multimanifer]|uniref:Cobalt transporter n=1 Tax=Polymorphobacter multimanifer TaxID=1070431 RepID=A0A841LHC3_9SPHN|nr:hypothetical protein [Polymorphobacter multimanifer]MBB6229205.1 hypothetical protein [Polymorphobacter multimanifer]